jgi:hypothetical protein
MFSRTPEVRFYQVFCCESRNSQRNGQRSSGELRSSGVPPHRPPPSDSRPTEQPGSDHAYRHDS